MTQQVILALLNNKIIKVIISIAKSTLLCGEGHKPYIPAAPTKRAANQAKNESVMCLFIKQIH
ncbi:hypothetical protein PNIG_a1753 [Pseudoalteromonas nigrifaciens]|uniref:Uncharacterized protein n=1 Tax=Pseudoalteromonas nigrifaciens TaxID=28109 RepID=A0AAC9UJD8_9GAMM|nr:hypothetical protein PNIG_a1753 [Pseudoalteromonas nigrifaciens]